MYACVSTLSAPTSAARRRHTSLVDHFMFIVAARELSAGGFVGKPNVSECARAYVWLRVSCVHVRRTKTSGDGRGERDESHVCGGSTTIYSRDPRSVCHPCPRPPPPSPCDRSVPPSLLILLLLLLLLFSYSPSILVVLRRVTPLSFRRWSKNKVLDSRCMNDNLIAGGLKSWKRFTSEY